jgi:hypothetical protein
MRKVALAPQATKVLLEGTKPVHCLFVSVRCGHGMCYNVRDHLDDVCLVVIHRDTSQVRHDVILQGIVSISDKQHNRRNILGLGFRVFT